MWAIVYESFLYTVTHMQYSAWFDEHIVFKPKPKPVLIAMPLTIIFSMHVYEVNYFKIIVSATDRTAYNCQYYNYSTIRGCKRFILMQMMIIDKEGDYNDYLNRFYYVCLFDCFIYKIIMNSTTELFD